MRIQKYVLCRGWMPLILEIWLIFSSDQPIWLEHSPESSILKDLGTSRDMIFIIFYFYSEVYLENVNKSRPSLVFFFALGNSFIQHKAGSF